MINRSHYYSVLTIFASIFTLLSTSSTTGEIDYITLRPSVVRIVLE